MHVVGFFLTLYGSFSQLKGEVRYYYNKREKAKKYPKQHLILIIDAMDQCELNIYKY